MTADRSVAEARKIAWSSALSVAITLLIVTWGGPGLLLFFGVSVDSLRAAGGLIVLLIGLHMLFNKSEHKQSPAGMTCLDCRMFRETRQTPPPPAIRCLYSWSGRLR